MNEKAICCDLCFDFLASKSAIAASFWLDLCDSHQAYDQELVGVFDPDEDLFNLLENHGFIISTEKSNYLIVKVLGRQEDEIGAFYCCRGCYD